MGDLSLVGHAVPDAFRVWFTVVMPGASRRYREAEWRDALVVVELGAIDVDAEDGSCERFGAGAVLWLAGLPVSALHNRGEEPALLSAVARRGSSYSRRHDRGT